jgi:hypothetical protein
VTEDVERNVTQVVGALHAGHGSFTMVGAVTTALASEW